MKILIIGNGSIGVDEVNKYYYIPQNAGLFLKKLSTKISMHYIDFKSTYNKNNNLLDFNLNLNNIEFSTFGNKVNPYSYLKILKLILNSDFVYLFYPGTLSRLVGYLCFLLSKPYGVYVRGEFYKENKLDHLILKNCRFILTISPLFALDLSKLCSDVNVIKPMINIQVSDFKLYRNYTLPDQVNLLFVGRVEERKGIYELLEIAQRLKSKKLNFILNIVGGGNIFNEVVILIEEYGLQNHIILHGLVSDKELLKAMYNNANAFIFTSHDEGFPRVLYEAMASALPIFTTFVGGISGMMVHLTNCVEIPVRNGEISSEIIFSFLNQTNLLKKIGVNGQKTLEEIIDGTLLPHEDILFQNLNSYL